MVIIDLFSILWVLLYGGTSEHELVTGVVSDALLSQLPIVLGSILNVAIPDAVFKRAVSSHLILLFSALTQQSNLVAPVGLASSNASQKSFKESPVFSTLVSNAVILADYGA